MTDEALTAERIVDATEEVLRRFGPAKATISDVARVLGVSHCEADALTEIATSDSSASERLRHWFDRLIASKRRKAFEDPELFATYVQLAAESREVVKAHIDGLVTQVTQIIADGVVRGEFTTTDSVASAWAIFHATSLFQYPEYASRWSEPGIDNAFEGVWSLLLCGLTARTPSASL